MTRRSVIASGFLALLLGLGVWAGCGVSDPLDAVESPALDIRSLPMPPPALATLVPERGAPAFVSRFSEAETGGNRQSWSVTQAPSGLIYVANSNGVLEYDGADWRLIPVPNFIVRAVAVGPDDRVYVGGTETAGVLVPDSADASRLVYQEVLASDVLAGEPVWGAFPTERGVVFQTFSRLVEVRGGAVYRFEEAPPGRRFHKAFQVARDVYVRLEGAGLLRYGDEGLQRVPGGAAFADRPVRALHDADGALGGALLAVTDDRLFQLQPGLPDPVEIPTAATESLQQTRAYHGCAIGGEGPRRLFAVTTLGNGVLLLNRAGEVVEHLWTHAQLGPDDLVLGCGVDVQGGLWLALSNGVLRVDAAAPLTTFDARQGLEGVVLDVKRHGGSLYVATERGVYRLDPEGGERPGRFVPVTYNGRSLDQAWSLVSTAQGLLATTTAGLYEVEGDRARLVSADRAHAVLVGDDEGVVSFGGGLFRLVATASGWEQGRRIAGIDGEARSILTWRGAVWAIEQGGRLLRIGRDDRIDGFDGADGVPEGMAAAMVYEDDLVVLAEEGPYRVGYEAGRLTVAPALDLAQLVARVTDDVADGYGFYRAGEGQVWAFGRDRLRLLEQTAVDWADVTPPALRGLIGIETVEVEGDVTWVGTSAGLYRLDAAGQERYAVPVPALLRSVAADGEALAAGADVPYRAPVRFRFSAAAFNDPERTQFRSQLLGHDARPSPWSDEHFRDYTNLPPGTYAFRVEARTATETTATPVVLRFAVPPPWYLTRWFMVLAAFLAFAVVAAIAQAASHHQRRRANAERDRADELDRLNAELVQADRLKDHMLANTSHELRTPLTAILGFSEILAEYEGGDPESVRDYASHMLNGGRRLLRTVNDVLDIAQLRAGKVALRARPVDAAAVARGIVEELRPLAAEKGLGLSVFPKGLAVEATVDPDALGRVLTNLVANAVKFTDNGAVSVTVDAEDDVLAVSVRDTGCGIEEAFFPRMFEAFEQESTGHGRTAEGNGLGLSITKQYVELMGGRIEVRSEVGAGTVFRVVLPATAHARLATSEAAPEAVDRPAPQAAPRPPAPTG